MAKRDEKATSEATSEATTRTAQGNCDENDRTEEQGTEDMVRDETGDADEKNDVTDDLMAELSEDELAELAELEELAAMEELEALEELDELDGDEEAWLAGDETDGDEEEGNPQEGIPSSDWLADGPDDQQGETDRTEETDEVEDPYDQIVDGYIYLITNLVNGKKYVGQTTKTIEWRWNSHIRDAYSNGTGWVSLIDRAIRKYGVENFTVQELEQVVQQTREYLDQREIYWIRHLKTCVRVYGSEAGYNVSHGGHSSHSFLMINEEKEVIRLYNDNFSINAIARHFHVSAGTITSIIDKYHLPRRGGSNFKHFIQQRCGIDFSCFRISTHEQYSFASSTDAARWVIQQRYSRAHSVNGIATRIRYAAAQQAEVYGFIWDMPNASDEYRQQVIQQAQRAERLQIERNRQMSKIYDHSKNKQCPICHEPITNQSTYCKKHSSIRRVFDLQTWEIVETHYALDEYPTAIPILGNYPLSLALAMRLMQFYTYSEIGKMYGVSANAVKKFLKDNYNITISRQKMFRLWNDDYECYMYYQKDKR